MLIIVDPLRVGFISLHSPFQELHHFRTDMKHQTGTSAIEHTEITVSPPESLVKYEAPLFVGIEPSANQEDLKAKGNLNNTKLEDMVDSIIPAR